MRSVRFGYSCSIYSRVLLCNHRGRLLLEILCIHGRNDPAYCNGNIHWQNSSFRPVLLKQIATCKIKSGALASVLHCRSEKNRTRMNKIIKLTYFKRCCLSTCKDFSYRVAKRERQTEENLKWFRNVVMQAPDFGIEWRQVHEQYKNMIILIKSPRVRCCYLFGAFGNVNDLCCVLFWLFCYQYQVKSIMQLQLLQLQYSSFDRGGHLFLFE